MHQSGGLMSLMPLCVQYSTVQYRQNGGHLLVALALSRWDLLTTRQHRRKERKKEKEADPPNGTLGKGCNNASLYCKRATVYAAYSWEKLSAEY